MFQIRVIGNSFHLIFNYLQYVRLDTGVVAVYLLLHDVVTVCILELVDDRDFFVGSGLRRHLLVIDDDTGMENLLLDFLTEVVRHAAHECTLREVGNLGSGYQGIQLRVDGGGCVLPVDGYGLPLLKDFAETLRKVLCRFAYHLSGENIADCILDHFRLFFTVVTGQLREVLEAETYRHLVASGGGYQVGGWEKAARMDSLGEGYGLEDLRAVLSGKKAHTPRKKTVTQAEPPKVNLLVDIQAKLQAGKGTGYAQWAKVFNLKQMAQTMNYLSENNLLEYAVLEEKATAATAHHNELSTQIKAAEKRMAEIAVLRTHIVNYAKTREVYVAYRKAGYSKKFREEHEEEILLHQAAKDAFDEMGVKKLPKVKELQTEYAKLLEEKKKTYAEYRRSREEMRELLTAKANVDRVLKMEVEQDVEKEKDHGQR